MIALQELFEMNNAEKGIILPCWQSFNITAFFDFAGSESMNHHQWKQQAIPVSGVPDGKSGLFELLA